MGAWRDRVDGALVVLRCENLTTLDVREPPTGLSMMDMDDPREIDEWLDVHNDAYGHGWRVQDFENAILQHPHIDVCATFFVRREGTAVGAASVGTYRRRPALGVGHYLGVRGSAQGSGVAGALAHHRYRWLASQGVTAAETQTHVARVGSLRLHFSLGFVPKYRLDSWNNPENVTRPERLVASARLWNLHRRWIGTTTAGVGT